MPRYGGFVGHFAVLIVYLPGPQPELVPSKTKNNRTRSAKGFQFLPVTPATKTLSIFIGQFLPVVPTPGFVGDVVLANVHFKLGWRIDRLRLRNQDATQKKMTFVSPCL